MVVLLGGVCALLHARRAQLRVSSLYWSLACDGIEQSSLEAHRDCNREEAAATAAAWERVERQGAETFSRPGLSD
jgi:hypothetical protein